MTWPVIWRRTAVLFACLLGVFALLFNRDQAADDILNEARSSTEYVHSFSYGFKDLDAGQLRRALAYYKTVLSGNLAVPLTHANAGFCQFYLGHVDAAASEYVLALEGNAGLYALYFDLGFIRMQQGRWGEAELLFRKSQALVPRDQRALAESLLVGAKHYQAPVFFHYFRNRVAYDKKMILLHLGTVYWQLKDHRKLLAHSALGISQYPDEPEFYYNAGVAAQELGFLQQAEVFFSHAGRTLPEEDFQKAKAARQAGAWQRTKDIQELHHWDDAIILFQVYK
jgi:tetratricopeptide (TPR) repeat protein